MATKRTFRSWLSGQRKRRDAVGDLARDVFADATTPDFKTLDEWHDHVGGGAVSDALDVAWHEFSPPSGPPKLRLDTNEIAYRTMLAATGEGPKPTPPGEGAPNPEAAKRGSAGGKKGGKARAANLVPNNLKMRGD
jgi:hypothetical protein